MARLMWAQRSSTAARHARAAASGSLSASRSPAPRPAAWRRSASPLTDGTLIRRHLDRGL
eukprot:scaffold32887_cov35-Phaeocystis_antarctica.AAC.2